MTKKSLQSTPATKQEIAKFTMTLRRARNKYENKLIEAEKIWGKLSKTDYDKRKLLIDLATELVEIDKSIKEWEAKI